MLWRSPCYLGTRYIWGEHSVKRWIWIPIVIVVGGALITWRGVLNERGSSARCRRDAGDDHARRTTSCGAGDLRQPVTRAPAAPSSPADANSTSVTWASCTRPNITPDKDTGIGAWSDDDFRAAMQPWHRQRAECIYIPGISVCLVLDGDR